ncbi:MAG: ribbon-helix-helix protein, CopG family [Actinomycetota bacterium]
MGRTEREMAEELYEHRHDEGEWEDEPAEVEVKPKATSVVSFRLPTEELDALEEAAERAGESVSEFVRKALALRLHGKPIGPTVEVSSGATRLVVRSHVVTESRTESGAGDVPDLPPMQAAIT